MRRVCLLTVFVCCFLVLANVALGQYVFEFTTELDAEGMPLNWQVIPETSITWEVDAESNKVIHTEIPVSLYLTDSFVHKWYVPVEMENIPTGATEAFYAISYDSVAIGAFPSSAVLKLQGTGEIHLIYFRLKQGAMDYSRPQVFGTLKKRTGAPVPKK